MDTSHIWMFGGSVVGVIVITFLVALIPQFKEHRLKLFGSVSIAVVLLYGGFIGYNWGFKYPGSKFKDIWNPFDLLVKSPPAAATTDPTSTDNKQLAERGDQPSDETLQCSFMSATNAYSYKTNERIPQSTSREFDNESGVQLTDSFTFSDLCTECDQHIYKEDNDDQKCVQYEYDLAVNEIVQEGVTTVDIDSGVCTCLLYTSDAADE